MENWWSGEFNWEHLIWLPETGDGNLTAKRFSTDVYTDIKRGDANAPPRQKYYFDMLSIIYSQSRRVNCQPQWY